MQTKTTRRPTRVYLVTASGGHLGPRHIGVYLERAAAEGAARRYREMTLEGGGDLTASVQRLQAHALPA